MRVTNFHFAWVVPFVFFVSIPYMRVTNDIRVYTGLYQEFSFNPLYAGHKPFPDDFYRVS